MLQPRQVDVAAPPPQGHAAPRRAGTAREARRAAASGGGLVPSRAPCRRRLPPRRPAALAPRVRHGEQLCRRGCQPRCRRDGAAPGGRGAGEWQTEPRGRTWYAHAYAATLARTHASAARERAMAPARVAGRAAAPPEARRRRARRAALSEWRTRASVHYVCAQVASALALLALLRTTLAHSARVKTIKHRLERCRPLECPRRAAPAPAKRTCKRAPKRSSGRVASACHAVARRHSACGPQ